MLPPASCAYSLKLWYFRVLILKGLFQVRGRKVPSKNPLRRRVKGGYGKVQADLPISQPCVSVIPT